MAGNFRRIRKSIGLALALSASVMPYAQALALDDNALPSNGVVVGGSASMDYSAPGRLDVHQNTERAVINWDSFNIGKNATTQFYQPSSKSMVVNRVTGSQNPTQILGTMKANGNVMVLDKNGVFFGHDSVIDVGGIVASTGDINDTAFMNDDNRLSLTGIDTGGSIINEGSITVGEAGLAAFVAPSVVNSGLIQAKLGRVALASGTAATLDLYGDGLVEVDATVPLQQALVENKGVITAEGGNVLLTASVAKQVVDAVINNSGIISVASAVEKGGKIVLEGANIKVSGTMDASGKTGGGIMHIGGEYLGGGTVRHADRNYIEGTAVLKANATGDYGDGGEIIVWSDQQTSVAGTIEAMAGALSGDGGFIETSSKINLSVLPSAKISASSLFGKNGQWLLDPRNVTITTVGGDDVSAGGIYDADSDNEQVSLDTVSAALSNGLDVTITTGSTGTQDGNITVSGIRDIIKNNGGEATLTLRAAGYISLSRSITSSHDKLNVVLNADSDGNQTGNVAIFGGSVTTNGGYFVSGGGSGALGGVDGILGNGDGTGPDDIMAYGLSTNPGFGALLGTINTGAGDIFINGAGPSGVNNAYGSYLFFYNLIGNNITINGNGGGLNGAYNNAMGVYLSGSNITADGNITIEGNGGSSNGQNAYGIHFDLGSIVTSNSSGTIRLTGTGGTSSNADGIYITGTSKVINIDGAIEMNGTNLLGTATTSEDGIFMDGTALVEARGNGNISLNGTTGLADPDTYGIRLLGSAQIIHKDDGDILLTGETDGGSDFYMSGTSNIDTTTGTGFIEFNIDSIFRDTGTITSASDIFIIPRTNSRTIGISGGTGDLNLTDTILAAFDPDGSLIIGNSASGTGDIDIDTWNLSALSYDIQIFGNDIDLGGITMGTGDVWLFARSGNITSSADSNSNNTGDLTLMAGGNVTINEDLVNAGTGNINIFAGWDSTSARDNPATFDFDDIVMGMAARNITLGANGTVSSDGAGTSVLMVATGDFANNATAGANAIVAVSGRYLIYADDIDTTVKGGIAGGDVYSKTYASDKPSAITGGSQFIFADSATLPPDAGGDDNTGGGNVTGSLTDNTPNEVAKLEHDEEEIVDPDSVDCLLTDDETGGCLIN